MREPTSHPLRVLFLTLEFAHGTFSGNGVLSSSQAHGLAKAGHAVLVVSGCPDDVNDEEAANLSDALPAAGEVSVRTLHVPGTKWGVLTSQCPWRELAESAQLATALHAEIAAFAPHVVLGIDWHVTPTWRALRKRVWPDSSDPEPLDAHATSPSAYPPFVYSNYRVFARDGDRTHATMEREAVEAAGSTIAVSFFSYLWAIRVTSCFVFNSCVRLTRITYARSCRRWVPRWRPGWSSRHCGRTSTDSPPHRRRRK